jgi:hypothetical protein
MTVKNENENPPGAPFVIFPYYPSFDFRPSSSSRRTVSGRDKPTSLLHRRMAVSMAAYPN